MKAYITGPLTHSEVDLEEIAKIFSSKGFECFVVQKGGSPKEIFDRDLNELKSCDVIVAEVSSPSHGVGAEIGMSVSLGLKRILLFKKGSKVSPLLLGLPDTEVVEYEELREL